MTKIGFSFLVAGAVLSGCASNTAPAESPAAATAHYRCDRNMEFNVRFADDSAMLESAPPLGSETLLRDAGGVTPQQTVYSNARMRAEFGLGASGREAIVRMPSPPLLAHCVRD